MNIAASIVAVVVGLLHLYFLTLEMFLWQKPRGLKTFNQTPAQAAATATLAKNQGLYNGFLSAGLFWSVLASDASMAFQLRLFFLGCVLVAGLYGAATVGKKILFVQAMPAAIGIALAVLAR